ncbi:MAG TPA: bifunctional DNA primase/polymerase, partial [Myxococcota bacterium]|nr:bifunctional DNA primase/polymerase [Myxococcota bacterium]
MSKLSYRQIAEPIFKLGYAPIPAISLGKKVPAKGFGHLTEASKEDAIKEIRGWDSPHQAACWLLDALDGSGMPDLDIIDYDDGNEVAWGTAAFGATPLTVSTGTEGKMHAYYRRDPSRPRNENGSMARCFGGRDVDWRTWHGYGMAPGTLHKSGKVYQAFLDGKPVDLASIPKEVFKNLPILSRDDTDRERGVGKYAPPVPLSEIQDFDLGVGAQPHVYHHGASGQVGKYPKEAKDASAIIPAGPWQGKTVAQVAQH